MVIIGPISKRLTVTFSAIALQWCGWVERHVISLMKKQAYACDLTNGDLSMAPHKLLLIFDDAQSPHCST